MSLATPLTHADVQAAAILRLGFVAAHGLDHVVNEPSCPRCRCGIDFDAPIECDNQACPLPSLFAVHADG